MREKETYKLRYESERSIRIKTEEMVGLCVKLALETDTRRLNTSGHILAETSEIYKSTQSIIETDQQIIKHLLRELKHKTLSNSESLLCVVHYLVVPYANENSRLRAENRRIKEKMGEQTGEIQELEDRILRDPTIPSKHTRLPFNIAE